MPTATPTTIAAEFRRQARRRVQRARTELAAALADLDRAESLAAAAVSAGDGPVSPRPLTGRAATAAVFIHDRPGKTGDEIARAIGVESVTFRRHIVPKLKDHGITNRRYGGGGYYPPHN